MLKDALVVGINSYQAEGLRNLQASAEDAEAIARILEQHGEFNIQRLPEAITRDTKKPYIGKEIQVSLTQLQDALIKLFNPQGRNIPDTALFYFSGHGIRSTSGITEGFLASSNVDPNQRFYSLSLQWLRRLLQESPIKQQIIWLDCCHSGELLNFNEADPGDVGQARDRSFIAASREFEQAYEDLGDRYSVLTKVLLEGLDPTRCPQQWITNISLVDFIDKNLKNATQRPIYSNFGAPIDLTRTLTATETITQTQATTEICPYKGLQYFESDDADYFYGREELTDTLLNKIRQDNFLAILGASGSGKSSVLRAGLVHQLKLGYKLANSRDWQILITVPTENPLKRLAELFVDSNLSQLDKAEQLGKAEGLLKEGAEGLRKLIQTAEVSRVVLIIDQFEEVFTLCQNNDEREKFFQCIFGALATTENKLCLILAMRVDFLGKCLEKHYSGLGKKIQENLITVTAMSEGQLREAIIKPADRVNLIVEEELVEEILRDVKGSPGILPLLQYTLTEIWKWKTDNCLKLTTYTKLGRIAGTLNKRATEVYNSFNEEEKETAKYIFLSLTQLGEGTENTRRRVLKRDLITNKHSETVIDNAVKKLADEKLIVTSEQVAKGSQLSREAVVDVAHEALIRNWDLLGKWLDESRSNLLEQRKIENDARAWQESGKKSDYLLQGFRLKEANKFQKESRDKYSLSTLAEAFIKKSISKKRNNLFKFLIIPLFGTGIVGFFLYR
ncbi:MAG: caspase family protein [Pleurocapsa minor HA4230-MV1]|jgi:energy-coupling factor transporter ATP-binding protein EcfA2|nr:caspase family protein [Pleurocapsa minor HA4230-MV1]